jgi:hypothetical protein
VFAVPLIVLIVPVLPFLIGAAWELASKRGQR